MRCIARLLRMEHYIKNLLVFVPLFFAGEFTHEEKLFDALIGFICFCFISSAIYILNDIKDVENDRMHPKKKNRPIASGKISIKKAILILIICCSLAIDFSIVLLSNNAVFILIAYFVINLCYSFGLKDKPIIDIVILASGFVLRIIYGGLITEVTVSEWLYLVVVSGSIFMGLGKRRNELKRSGGDTRRVLKYYTESFLDKNMYVCMALVNVFYSLWAINSAEKGLIWSVPIVIIIMMKYSLDIEGDSDGDPVDVILKDRILMLMVVLYVVYIAVFLYIF